MDALEGAWLNRARCQTLLCRWSVDRINVNTWLGFPRRPVDFLHHFKDFTVTRIVSLFVLLEIHSVHQKKKQFNMILSINQDYFTGLNENQFQITRELLGPRLRLETTKFRRYFPRCTIPLESWIDGWPTWRCHHQSSRIINQNFVIITISFNTLSPIIVTPSSENPAKLNEARRQRKMMMMCFGSFK